MAALDTFLSTRIAEHGIKTPRLVSEVVTNSEWSRRGNVINVPGVFALIVDFRAFYPGLSGADGQFGFGGDRGDTVVYTRKNCHMEVTGNPDATMRSERVSYHQSQIKVNVTGSSVGVNAFIEIIHVMEG